MEKGDGDTNRKNDWGKNQPNLKEKMKERNGGFDPIIQAQLNPT